MDALMRAFAIAGGAVIILFTIMLLWKMATNKIDLKDVLMEDGKASLSRLQFLIFTFVIALSYFLLVIRANTGTPSATFILPDISPGVLGLMGISGGSYVLSKGIQKAADVAGSSPTGTPPAGGADQAVG